MFLLVGVPEITAFLPSAELPVQIETWCWLLASAWSNSALSVSRPFFKSSVIGDLAHTVVFTSSYFRPVGSVSIVRSDLRVNNWQHWKIHRPGHFLCGSNQHTVRHLLNGKSRTPQPSGVPVVPEPRFLPPVEQTETESMAVHVEDLLIVFRLVVSFMSNCFSIFQTKGRSFPWEDWLLVGLWLGLHLYNCDKWLGPAGRSWVFQCAMQDWKSSRK